MSDISELPAKKSLNAHIWLPVTMQQFQDLTNELLAHVNVMTQPHALEGDYFAQVLMSAIHAIDHKQGKVKKNQLLEACVNRISCHVTYHAVEEIQKRLKAQKDGDSSPDTPATETDILPDEVRGTLPELPDSVA